MGGSFILGLSNTLSYSRRRGSFSTASYFKVPGAKSSSLMLASFWRFWELVYAHGIGKTLDLKTCRDRVLVKQDPMPLSGIRALLAWPLLLMCDIRLLRFDLGLLLSVFLLFTQWFALKLCLRGFKATETIQGGSDRLGQSSTHRSAPFCDIYNRTIGQDDA